MNTTPILSIPLEHIRVGERLRPVDPAYVALLAASLAERGQDTPIQVRPRADAPGAYDLVAGGHRVAAAQLAGIEALQARVVEATDDEARLAEIDENLMRRELSALDRAVFLAARQEVYLRLHPQTARGKNNKTKRIAETTSLSFQTGGFARATAQRLGLDERTIQRAVSRARIDPAVRALLAGHPVAESGAELDKIAAQPAAIQAAIAERLTRLDRPARNVAAAMAEIAGPQPESREAEQRRQFHALLGAWRKAGRPARRLFLDHLADEGELDVTGKERAA